MGRRTYPWSVRWATVIAKPSLDHAMDALYGTDATASRPAGRRRRAPPPIPTDARWAILTDAEVSDVRALLVHRGARFRSTPAMVVVLPACYH